MGVFLGLDVGKKVFDRRLPNSEPKLRAVFDKLTAEFGALPLTVARDTGCEVAPTCPDCPHHHRSSERYCAGI